MIVLSKFLHTAKNYWVRHNNCSSQQKKKKKNPENKRKEWLQRKTRWHKSSQMCSTSLSVDTSGIHLQMQKISQNTSWEQTGVPDHWKGIYRSKTQQDKGRKGKRGGWAGPDLHLGLGELKQGSDPQIEAIVGDTGEVFEAVGEWSSWSGTVWMEWEPDNPCCSRMYPGRDPSLLKYTVSGSWSIGTGEQSPGEGCWWLLGDSPEGHEGGVMVENIFGEMLSSHWSKAVLLSHVQGEEPSL